MLLRTQPLYVRHAGAADRGAWSVERDIRWKDIDREKAHARPALLSALRDAALIESYHPVHLAGLLASTRDDIDAGVVFSLELYEGFKHFHALRTYLETVHFSPRITEEELVAIRQRSGEDGLPDVLGGYPESEGVSFDGDGDGGGDGRDRGIAGERGVAGVRNIDGSRVSDRNGGNDGVVEGLVEFMLSEHLAAYFFRRLGEQAVEPVLAELLELIAADEVRHAQSASDLIAKRIAADPGVIPHVLEAAAHFRHYGERAVDTVPVAQAGDPIAISTFARRIERLCGIRLVDHLKASL